MHATLSHIWRGGSVHVSAGLSTAAAAAELKASSPSCAALSDQRALSQCTWEVSSRLLQAIERSHPLELSYL